MNPGSYLFTIQTHLSMIPSPPSQLPFSASTSSSRQRSTEPSSILLPAVSKHLPSTNTYIYMATTATQQPPQRCSAQPRRAPRPVRWRPPFPTRQHPAAVGTSKNTRYNGPDPVNSGINRGMNDTEKKKKQALPASRQWDAETSGDKDQASAAGRPPTGSGTQ
ncbi:hypothetical protein BU26DRAFT_499810 [Trematosphaeria pertusa]|uniref:Uncharacterized protein n=1 Tax=Trematosphaeria pertusa TaxID=390896 RepID=A0A6A6J3L4_9PLEO|nr:uncharacterized protein BU26DRAFT_499810 [Trematosphaeria pertusa]KAF2257289.1 hypothetical protein BU26DRAFT_499810 [Trematosphaeria pertusa]